MSFFKKFIIFCKKLIIFISILYTINYDFTLILYTITDIP